MLDAEEGNHLEDTLVDTSAFRQVQWVDNQMHWADLLSWDHLDLEGYLDSLDHQDLEEDMEVLEYLEEDKEVWEHHEEGT